MAYISKELREKVVTRVKGIFEYCQTAQTIVVEREVDHIVPESTGGLTEEHNLCLTCISCNHFKRDYRTGIDPATDQMMALFNPRTQIWREHFEWSEGWTRIIGLTPTGRATIQRLNMNRDLVIKARERWVKAGWHPPN